MCVCEQKALGYFDEMFSYGLHPDISTHNVALFHCYRAGQHKRALDIFRALQAAGPAPNEETYKCVSCLLRLSFLFTAN